MNTFGDRAYDKSLVRGARAAINDVLAVKRNERVLIITNPDREVREISMALFDIVLEKKGSPTLMFQKAKGQFDFAEEEVVKAIAAAPDICLSISSDKLGKDQYGLKHGYRGKGKKRYDSIFELMYEERQMRAFWSPGITADMFKRTVPIDYTQLRSDVAKICKAFLRAESVRIAAPGGTDITIGVKGRKPKADDGDFRKPRRAGNIPTGEVFVSPALGTATGAIAFDGSIVLNEGEIVIRKPIVTEIKGGFITDICGGSEAEELRESIKLGEKKALMMGKTGQMKSAVVEKYARNAHHIGELGIGLNRMARIVANMLEDEKVYGTCHFAVGSNYDNDAPAMIHLDGIVKSPSIIAVERSGAEKQLMVDGRLVWD